MGAVKEAMLEDMERGHADLTDEKPVVREMVEWFFQTYEDPAENTPFDEGEYVFIHGGPYTAEEELWEKYPNAADADMARAVELIEEHGIVEWAKKDIGEIPEDDGEPEEGEPEEENGPTEIIL